MNRDKEVVETDVKKIKKEERERERLTEEGDGDSDTDREDISAEYLDVGRGQTERHPEHHEKEVDHGPTARVRVEPAHHVVEHVKLLHEIEPADCAEKQSQEHEDPAEQLPLPPAPLLLLWGDRGILIFR